MAGLCAPLSTLKTRAKVTLQRRSVRTCDELTAIAVIRPKRFHGNDARVCPLILGACNATARVHHAFRWHSSDVAACRARTATGRTGLQDWIPVDRVPGANALFD